jgi:hypothetical protein
MLHEHSQRFCPARHAGGGPQAHGVLAGANSVVAAADVLLPDGYKDGDEGAPGSNEGHQPVYDRSEEEGQLDGRAGQVCPSCKEVVGGGRSVSAYWAHVLGCQGQPGGLPPPPLMAVNLEEAPMAQGAPAAAEQVRHVLLSYIIASDENTSPYQNISQAAMRHLQETASISDQTMMEIFKIVTHPKFRPGDLVSPAVLGRREKAAWGAESHFTTTNANGTEVAHTTILGAVSTLLCRPGVMKACSWAPSNLGAGDDPILGILDGDNFRCVKNHVDFKHGAGHVRVLALMLVCDETVMMKMNRGRDGYKPLRFTVGNLPQDLVWSPSYFITAGYLGGEGDAVEWFHVPLIREEIAQLKIPFLLQVGEEEPRLTVIYMISAYLDWQERTQWLRTMASTSADHCCCGCMISKRDLANVPVWSLQKQRTEVLATQQVNNTLAGLTTEQETGQKIT